jgi:hypothetical protein
MINAIGELQRIWVEAVGTCFKLLSRHSPRRATKITKYLSQDSRYTGRGSNRMDIPAEYCTSQIRHQLNQCARLFRHVL